MSNLIWFINVFMWPFFFVTQAHRNDCKKHFAKVKLGFFPISSAAVSSWRGSLIREWYQSIQLALSKNVKPLIFINISFKEIEFWIFESKLGFVFISMYIYPNDTAFIDYMIIMYIWLKKQTFCKVALPPCDMWTNQIKKRIHFNMKLV